MRTIVTKLKELKSSRIQYPFRIIDLPFNLLTL
jgi:hypothetical protein